MADEAHQLSPLRVRLLVFAAMAAVALLAIMLIDRRAMIRMHEMGAGYAAPEQPPESASP